MRFVTVSILALFLALPGFTSAENSVIALCYHTFLGKEKISTDFSIPEFSNQMTSIRSLGYKFVTWDDILADRVEGVSNVLITIDDGNASVVNADKAVLAPMGIRPVLFIYPAIITRIWYAMKWQDVSNFVAEGCDLGVHGYNHLYVNQKLYDSDRASFNREIYFAKKDFEKHMATNLDLYGYPFGAYSAITLEHLRKAGYRYAMTIDHGDIQLPLTNNKNPLLLPRWMVTKGEWHGIYQHLQDRLSPDYLANQKAVKKNGRKS
jgi:peptidoglycan/xylan/chitin deacetylase (PgdA/CDA1 family)